MEIQKIFSDEYDEERLYSVLMSEEELALFSSKKEKLKDDYIDAKALYEETNDRVGRYALTGAGGIIGTANGALYGGIKGGKIGALKGAGKGFLMGTGAGYLAHAAEISHKRRKDYKDTKEFLKNASEKELKKAIREQKKKNRKEIISPYKA